MAEPKSRAGSFFTGLIRNIMSAVVAGAVVYALSGFVFRMEFLKDYYAVLGNIRYLFTFATVITLVLTTSAVLLKAVRARKAREKVDEVLDKIKGETPGKNVAEISTQDVATFLRDTKVDDDQLVRLVEQRKQELLIDEEYFREELSSLIVDYLQPLPRNAKRFLNRFRVNLLIAHGRGLLTSDPRVTAQQIGKWLVLMERWPQLGRSLSAVPEKMKVLEEQSASPGAPQSLAPQLDPFMESIKTLAPFYVGDEDLRKFINSAPPLAMVVPRLVHYGTVHTMASEV